jgi:N utilization substance protein B
MNRRVARLRAAQALYQIDLTGSDSQVAIDSVLDEGEIPSTFMLDLVHGTLEHKGTIDPVISSSLQGWTLDRMGLVDRAIVRMTLFEMKYIEDIPVNVTFNEGIELAKAFGGEESGKFVNGVLSKAIESLKN